MIGIGQCKGTGCSMHVPEGVLFCTTCEKKHSAFHTQKASATMATELSKINKTIDASIQANKQMEHSGGDVNYYLLDIVDPKRMKPCRVECEDIIEALGMTFAEGNVFKALWRSCNMRMHGHGKRTMDDDGVYDGDKISYYGDRVKVQRHRVAKAKKS